MHAFACAQAKAEAARLTEEGARQATALRAAEAHAAELQATFGPLHPLHPLHPPHPPYPPQPLHPPFHRPSLPFCFPSLPICTPPTKQVGGAGRRDAA